MRDEAGRRRVSVPRIGRDGAGDDLDEGRLARAVLADQRVHLAGAQVERDALQRADAGERLRDAGGLKKQHGSGMRIAYRMCQGLDLADAKGCSGVLCRHSG